MDQLSLRQFKRWSQRIKIHRFHQRPPCLFFPHVFFSFLLRRHGVWESEDGREDGGESGSGATEKGYQPGGTLYLSRGDRAKTKMIEFTFNKQGELMVSQRDMSPTVYLDHWALRQFSENQKLADRLTEGLDHRNGTLALSWLNLVEFTKMTIKDQARRTENLFESNLPRVFFLEVEPFAVIRREDDLLAGGPPAAPHADLELLYVFSQFKPTALKLFTAKDLFRVVQNSGLEKRFNHLADTMVDRVRALRKEMDTNPQFRAKLRRSASGPQIQRGTRFILREMVRTLLVDKGTKLTRNQAIGKISGSGLGYCDLVSFLKNLAIPNAEFGLQIAEFSICFRLGHRDQ